MRRILIAVLCLTFVLAGCKAKEDVDAASISKDLDQRGTIDLAKEIAKDEYTAPEDGRITEAQVQMYLKVREHEKKIAEVAKTEMKEHAQKAEKDKSLAGLVQGLQAMGSAADFLTADLRAAKDLGYNTQEYIWVKGQILAASTAAMAEKFNQAMAANFDKAYQDAKKAYDSATDEPTKKLYADVLAGYEKSKQEITQQVDAEPAASYNRQLLSKYENALNAFAHELSRFEEKPGDVQKSVQEFEKNVEEAKKQ
jgi:nitrous oxide reductase accessory protein NosL